MASEPIRTILVEDQEVVRVGIRTMLQSGNVQVIGEFADGKTAVDRPALLQPDLVLMDIGLPVLDGIKATKLIKDTVLTKVIIITSYDDDRDVFAGLAAGADGYCLKGLSPRQLLNLIECVMEGGVWIALRSWRMRNSAQNSGVIPGQRPLSHRELQILALVVEGLSNQEMAVQLKLSTETIKTHMRHVMEKLGVSDRTQAAVKAVSRGIIRPVKDPDVISDPAPDA